MYAPCKKFGLLQTGASRFDRLISIRTSQIDSSDNNMAGDDAWLDFIDDDGCRQRLMAARIQSNSKWLERLSEWTRAKFDTVFPSEFDGDPLQPLDVILLEEAIGAALGVDDWEFSTQPRRNHDAQPTQPQPGRNQDAQPTQDPREGNHDPVGQRGLTSLGTRPLRLNLSDPGTVMFNIEFTSFLAAVCEASGDVKPRWCPKVCRALVWAMAKVVCYRGLVLKGNWSRFARLEKQETVAMFSNKIFYIW